MGAEITEGHDFTGRRNLVQSPLLATQVKAGHAQAAAVAEDQALERPVAISDDERQSLLGDRDDPAVCLRRLAAIEHAKLDARHIFLGDRVHSRLAQIGMQLVRRFGDDDAGSALAFIRLQDDRKRQPLALQPRMNSIALCVRRVTRFFNSGVASTNP